MRMKVDSALAISEGDLLSLILSFYLLSLILSFSPVFSLWTPQIKIDSSLEAEVANCRSPSSHVLCIYGLVRNLGYRY